MGLKPIYYDTETTGTRSDKDRIIEIAAYDPVEKRTFIFLVNPTSPIPSDATAIHGITDEMVAASPTFKEVGAEFIAFCGEEAVLIAHNNDSFDRPFLECEFARANLTPPAWKYVDSLKWSRKYRSDLPRHSLQALREVYGIAANQAHRALDDVLVLEQVFSQMIDDLSIETVLDLLAQKTEINRMPFGKHQGKALADIPPDYVRWLDESGALAKAQNQDLRAAFAQLGFIT